MTLYVLQESDSPIVQALGENFTIEVLDPETFSCANCGEDVVGLIIECNDYSCMTQKVKSIVAMFLNCASKAVVLLDVDKTIMNYLIGISMNCTYAVVQPMMGNQLVVNCIDCGLVRRTWGSQTVTIDKETGKQTKSNTMPGFGQQSIMQLESTPEECASKISCILGNCPNTTLQAEQDFGFGASESILPPGQYKTYYVKLSGSNKVDPDQSQEYANELVFVVELVASYDNPPYKYLQITTLGAGLNPTKGRGMQWNSSTNRGYWQNSFNLKMTPNDESLLTNLANEPKNINNANTYTVSNSLTVGVNISENPSFNPSYTLQNQYTTVINDFLIINKTIPTRSEWQFQLGTTRNNIQDIFNNKVVYIDVKELPLLATQNLQPYCSSVWYTDKSYNGKTSVRIDTDIYWYHAWANNYFFVNEEKWQWWHLPKSTTIDVDFSAVNA